jgi:copper oxidase (laccase) domain-containing protein
MRCNKRMSFDFETHSPEKFQIPARYWAIETASKKSFYLTNPHRSFDAYQSIQSIGEVRQDHLKLSGEAPTIAQAATRMIAGGNMSTVGPYGPVELSQDERIADAKENMHEFIESLGIPKTSVYMLNPERDYSTPLTVVDVDVQDTVGRTDWPLCLNTSGDFLFTRDPHKVLAVRPADCPVMIATADTPEGKVYMMVHYAWKGAAHGYIKQTADIFDTLGVDRSSLEMYLTPGGQAESYSYENYPQNPIKEYPGTEGLFFEPQSRINDEGKEVWDFGIDTPKFVYDQVLMQFGVDPSQIFCDTSDTSALNSGYSSHGRSSRLKNQGESNTRDLVLAVFHIQ